MKAITTAAMQIRATPPTTPPTIAPIGTEAGVDVDVDVDVDVPGVVPGDGLGETEEGAAAVGGYCVPVLRPLDPVYTGKSIGSDWPVYVSSILKVKPGTVSQMPCAT
jgi:hypothetical protein